MYVINFLRCGLGTLGLLLCFLVQAQPQAESPDFAALAAEAQWVEALLNAELTQLSTKQNRPLSPDAFGGGAHTAIYLKAMYGVGKHVLAEVEHNGKSYVYVRGQVWPIGDQKGLSQLRLLSMSTRCVELAYKEQTLSACVVPQGG